MRKKYKEQLPLMGHTIDHPHAAEMALIDTILEKNATIYDLPDPPSRKQKNLVDPAITG